MTNHSLETAPRDHHYTFCHVAVRRLFFMSPDRFFSLLFANSLGFLNGLWERVGSHLPEGQRLKNSGLLALPNKGEEYLSVIIRPPEAKRLTEAIFVGCLMMKKDQIQNVMKMNMKMQMQTDPKENSFSETLMRFFTLEFGKKDDESAKIASSGCLADATVSPAVGPPRTLFCEWTREGKHLNYGDGPEPVPAVFHDWMLRKTDLFGKELPPGLIPN